jgi:hypothetical protein
MTGPGRVFHFTYPAKGKNVENEDSKQQVWIRFESDTAVFEKTYEDTIEAANIMYSKHMEEASTRFDQEMLSIDEERLAAHTEAFRLYMAATRQLRAERDRALEALRTQTTCISCGLHNGVHSIHCEDYKSPLVDSSPLTTDPDRQVSNVITGHIPDCNDEDCHGCVQQPPSSLTQQERERPWNITTIHTDLL